MSHIGQPLHAVTLESVGLHDLESVVWNQYRTPLVEQALCREEGQLSRNGALVVRTGKFTGRSPKDKFIVDEPSCHDDVWWSANQSISEECFDRLHKRMTDYLTGKRIYVQDLFGGTDIRYRLPVRIITEYAWHSLFARLLLVEPDRFRGATLPVEDLAPPFTIIDAPGCTADPKTDGTNSETFIVINFARRMVLIGGTEYAGEIKKAVFTVLNYLLPLQGIMPMHCSANIGRHHGDTALFFGLSGTGKTTLSADPTRILIGDDEHGWSSDGIFNFEGGCYAKCIRLSKEAEPEIWSAIRFGTVLENVVINPEDRIPDFNAEWLTENTRAAYPIDNIPNASGSGQGSHPDNVVFLTADAFGVLPPISKLTFEQARFHFISGYTARVAGTERGLGNEPQVTFSACFGLPFLPLHPARYSRLLGEKLVKHNVDVWLINTGWSGGPFGVGKRMNIHYTRAMVDAAIEGALNHVGYRQDPIFGLRVPLEVPNVPCQALNPRDTWEDKEAYDAQARELARRFRENIDKFKDSMSPEVYAAAPRG